MKIVFISNYFNHHQRPLCDAMSSLTGGNYRFIATSHMLEERRKLGYGNWEIPGYVLDMTEEAQKKNCLDAIDSADVLITGSCPADIFRYCCRTGKPVFVYSERLRKNDGFIRNLRISAGMYKRIPHGKNLYLLAAGAYVYGDYRRLGYFKDRGYKWGYFPELKRFDDTDRLIAEKRPGSVLWAGRLIEYKHAEHIVKAAKILSERVPDFSIDIIGSGVKEDPLAELISSLGLGDTVKLCGSMPPEQVRSRMERSGIFVITADKEEGWGAVLNEAMNSACAIITNPAPGSTPYLINDGENGLLYEFGDISSLADKLGYLLCGGDRRAALGKAAYRTVSQTWNADVAAERFTLLAERILSGEKNPDIFKEGPCSKA